LYYHLLDNVELRKQLKHIDINVEEENCWCLNGMGLTMQS
jgi:hypothetical protein